MGIKGVAILRVTPGSSAANSGLEAARLRSDSVIVPGDIITKIEGMPVESISKYYGLMDDFKIGEDITISIHRHGENLDVIVRVQGG
jgi:S1-C subfamily serine protease